MQRLRLDLAGLSGVISNPRQILSLCVTPQQQSGRPGCVLDVLCMSFQEHPVALYVDQQSGNYYGQSAAVMDGNQFQPAAPVRLHVLQHNQRRGKQ